MSPGTPPINSNIVEKGVKHHNTNPNFKMIPNSKNKITHDK